MAIETACYFPLRWVLSLVANILPSLSLTRKIGSI
jgi:hypothetical protein